LRKFHRWLATLAMLFLLYVSVTGTLLQFNEIQTGGGANLVRLGPPPGTGPAVPGAVSVTPFPPGRGPHTANAFLEDLHNGSVIGKAGRWIDLAVGIILIVLSVTGSVMFLQMLWLRRGRGRKSWFWK
jgi:hypothetical protein